MNRESLTPAEEAKLQTSAHQVDPYRRVMVAICWILAAFLAVSALFILYIYWMRDL